MNSEWYCQYTVECIDWTEFRVPCLNTSGRYCLYRTYSEFKVLLSIYSGVLLSIYSGVLLSIYSGVLFSIYSGVHGLD